MIDLGHGSEIATTNIHLRSEVRFDDGGKLRGIVFDRFLPLVGQARSVPLGGTEFEVTVVVDAERHRSWLRDIPLDDLSRRLGIGAAGVFILLSTTIPTDLMEVLKTSETNDDTRAFGVRVLAAIEQVHDSLVDFVRNQHQQVHVEPRRIREGQIQQRLMAYDTRFRQEDGWHLLMTERDPVVLQLEATDGIGPEEWRVFTDALGQGRFRVHAHRRLVANAFAHFRRHDHRAAIVEAIAAWEMVMNNEAPRRLAEARVEYDERDWKALLDKAGLRAGTRLFLTFVAERLPKLVERREELLDAIEMRNTVVHNGRQRIERDRAKVLLRAVRDAVLACEDAA